MSARFRCLGPGGREIEIATSEELVRAFTSGALTEDTLLYDAHGGGWAPARSHSALLGIPLPAAVPPRADAAEPTRGDAGKARSRTGEATPYGPEPRVGAAHTARNAEAQRAGSSGAPTTPWPDSPRPAVSWTPPPQRPARARAQPVWVVGLPHDELDPTDSGSTPRSQQAARRWASALGPAGASAVGLLFVALIVIFAQSPASGGEGAVRSVSAAGPASGQLPAAEVDPLVDMVAEMERRQSSFRIERVPVAWLDGIYLAEAGRFPDVREFWQSYGDYVREMRASEERLFEETLTQRLSSRGLPEAQLSMQAGRALNEFRADESRRDEVYDQLLELSEAALDLHVLLIEHEVEISYVPAEPGLSHAPLAEAVTEDRRLAAEMTRRLERVFKALEATQGSRTAPREELPQALRRGLTSNARTSMR